MPRGPVLIAYDGSENAKHAIRVAAAEIGGGSAQVVHVWEPLSSGSSRLAVYAVMAGAGPQELASSASRLRLRPKKAAISRGKSASTPAHSRFVAMDRSRRL